MSGFREVAGEHKNITAADADLDPVPAYFMVSGAGTLVLTSPNGGVTTVTLPNGGIFPGPAKRVAAASTATGIVAFF